MIRNGTEENLSFIFFFCCFVVVSPSETAKTKHEKPVRFDVVLCSNHQLLLLMMVMTAKIISYFQGLYDAHPGIKRFFYIHEYWRISMKKRHLDDKLMRSEAVLDIFG